MPVFILTGPVDILELLVSAGLCASKSEARRAVQQRSVKIDSRVVDRPDEVIQPGEGVLQKGRRSFVRLKAGIIYKGYKKEPLCPGLQNML